MAKKLIKRFLPHSHSLGESRVLRILGKHLHSPSLWRFNRHSAAQGTAVGVFVAFIPIPLQMLLAAALALVTRANLPLAIGLVWITNPLTMPFLWYGTYRLGCVLLDRPHTPEHGFEMSLHWFHEELTHIWQPLYLGSFVSGLVLALASYVLVQLLWRFNIVRAWRQRRERKRSGVRRATAARTSDPRNPQL